MIAFVRCLGLAAVVLSATTALGQGLTQLDASGKIIDIGPTVITVKTLANSVIYCSIDPARMEGNAKVVLPTLVIEVNGDLTTADLQKGAIVRFTIELDMRKQVGEVSEVTVLGMTEPPNVSLGMLAESGEDLGKAKKPVTGKYIVVGRIDSARGGYLDVDFPGGKQKAKLAADATVKLTASDLSFARVGDDIHVEGGYVTLPRAYLSKATITRAKAEKKPVRGPQPPIGKSPAPRKVRGGEEERPDGFGVGDPRADAPPAVAGEAARPKEKGKILKVN